MSLIIKGMDMSKSCSKCDLRVIAIGLDFQCAFSGETVDDCYSTRHKKCPLVKIPTPHGRLIDADELLRVIEENSYRLRSVINSTENGMFLSGIRQAIDESPTIIEAENSSAIDDDVKKYCDYLKSETYDFCNRIENGEVNEG